MRVDWAIPCRYVEVQPQGGATIVGAGADVTPVPEFPAAIQQLFAVRFVGDPDEFDGEQQHPFAARLFGPDGEPMGEQAGQLIGGVEQIVPGYVAEMIVPMGFVVAAERAGTYRVEFEIDGNTLPVPIHIVEAPAA